MRPFGLRCHAIRNGERIEPRLVGVEPLVVVGGIQEEAVLVLEHGTQSGVAGAEGVLVLGGIWKTHCDCAAACCCRC